MTKDEFLIEVFERFTWGHQPLTPDAVLVLTPKRLADILVMVGALKPEKVRYRKADLMVVCPVCQAPPGEECRTQPSPKGTWLPSPHALRQIAADDWVKNGSPEST